MKRETKKSKQEAENELRKNPINNFVCCNETFDYEDFTKHLNNVHKISPKNLKGTKKAISHMDGDYWFSWDYKWELENGLKFTQHTMQARSKDDLMRF